MRLVNSEASCSIFGDTCKDATHAVLGRSMQILVIPNGPKKDSSAKLNPLMTGAWPQSNQALVRSND